MIYDGVYVFAILVPYKPLQKTYILCLELFKSWQDCLLIIELHLNLSKSAAMGITNLNLYNSHLTLCVMYVTFFTFKIFNIIYTEFKLCFKMVIKMFYKVAI